MRAGLIATLSLAAMALVGCERQDSGSQSTYDPKLDGVSAKPLTAPVDTSILNAPTAKPASAPAPAPAPTPAATTSASAESTTQSTPGAAPVAPSQPN